MNSQKKIRVAVIGAGVMGYNHIRTYAKMPQVDLVAIADINETRGEEIASSFHTRYYKQYQKLLSIEKPQAVSVVVPTSLHMRVALDCLKAGVHILVEKPLATTTTAAKKIAAFAKEKHRILFVGHIERYNPAVTALQKILVKKELGSIVSIAVKRVGLPSTRNDDVGVVTDLAVHDLDITCALLGMRPRSITARGGSITRSDREDHAEIFLDFKTFAGFIQVNWITPIKIRSLAITGTRGYAEINFISQELYLYKTENTIKKTVKFADFVASFGNPKRVNVQVKRGEPLEIELHQFIKAVQENNHQLFDPGDAVNAVYLSELVKKSIDSGKTIQVSRT